MADKRFQIKTELTFSESDISEIIKSRNRYLDNPITMEDVKSSPKLQAYLASELSNTTDEIVFSSPDSIDNGWLDDIEAYK